MFETGNVVVPWDFSQLAESALKYALGFLAPEQIKLVCVIEQPVPDAPAMIWKTATEESVIQKCHEKLMERLTTLGCDSIEPHILFGDPADEIVSFASTTDATAIVMSTHGRTGLPRVLLGSIAEKVMREAPCPVFLIPRTWTVSTPAVVKSC